MQFRAKFWVSGNEPFADGSRVTLSPVTGGSPENEQFYRATPGGVIELVTINTDISNQLHFGDEFIVDFVRTRKADSG